MKRSFILLITLSMSFFVFGQSYSSLWKKVAEAQEKDLPKSEYAVLQQIVKKATKDKAYGQLLKAELQGAQAMASVAPDSLLPELNRIRERGEAATDEVLKVVYQTILHKVSNENYDLRLGYKKPDLTPELCDKLAKVKDDNYSPMVIKGIDADIFNHDLLHVVGYELSNYEDLYHYYQQAGNRRAACVVAAQNFRFEKKEKIEELISQYADLPEVGELVILRYKSIPYGKEYTDDRYDYIQKVLPKWDRWPRMAYLRNELAEITNPQIRMEYDRQVVRPGQTQTVRLEEMRHVDRVTMTIYKVDANGSIGTSPVYDSFYKKVKPLLREVAFQKERVYTDKKPYEFFEDTLTIGELPIGVYMVEMKTEPATEVVRRMYFVSDVYIMAEAQPAGEGVRYVVVNATTGQPISGARLRIREKVNYSDWKQTDATADEKGEYIFKPNSPGNEREVFAYTATDKASPCLNGRNRYEYYGNRKEETHTNVYTDRSIYRPGQTMHVAALVYKVKEGMNHEVSGEVPVKFVLRDPNYKIVEEKNVLTDAYGVCSADFVLPSSGITGRYTIMADDEHLDFRVEEYKRPTFHVDFPEVKEAYAAGDTLKVKGTAMSYAGVPVQGAKVTYKVERSTAFWWWSYSRYWSTLTVSHSRAGDEVFTGEVTTGEDGSFDVQMPLTMPETDYPMFYTFKVTADVTDAAGETHSGQMALPLGNRKQTFQVNMPEKSLLEEKPKAVFHLLNASGRDIEGQVRYQIDGGQWLTVKTNQPVELNKNLKSGAHTLEAVCQGDTLKRNFVLFSLDDEAPAVTTDDWFYQSSSQFTNDGSPVTIQVGSSDENVHIVYSIFAGNQVIERGAVDRSNRLFKVKSTYEETYGNGLLMTFAWVKNGQCYQHSAVIQRPLPNKRLKLKWTTFRDKLTPGQKEEWTLSILDPEGKPADAQLMATLYDKSLDQLKKHQWGLVPYVFLPLPNTRWVSPSVNSQYAMSHMEWRAAKVEDLQLSRFDEEVFPSYYRSRFRRFSRGAVADGKMVYDEMVPMAEPVMAYGMKEKAVMNETASEAEAQEETEDVQVRENLNETAFFYPQLTTDETGHVALKFTLPESLTTWRFMGIAHTKDMFYGDIDDETIAQKEVMIQPNVPRFLRDGDQASITARVFNTSEKALTGKAVMKLLDPETEAVVAELSQPVTLKAGGTAAVTFNYTPDATHSLLICKMTVSGKGFADGEQHYLPVLPSTERVTVTVPITQHHVGQAVVDLASLIPATGKNGKLTFEYTNNPAWLMIQALPVMGNPSDDDAISQAASYYANSLGRYILSQNPQAKTAFDLWKQEAEKTSLTSALEKNQELKDIVLNETPWVMDAERETEQKQRLGDFFDENLMQNRLGSAVGKLKKLQRADGSWSWWPDMPGSFYMTVAISEMLVRLNEMTEVQNETKQMLTSAFGFMGQEMVEEVKELKKWKKEGHEISFPSFKALEWLYLCTLDGRELPADVKAANKYLLDLMKKDIKSQTIYEKALAAIILSKPEPKRALEYAQSLKEYTVFREELGRYYDTPRAGYSWYDYKIPTQTVAIEALQRLTPDDRQTVEEMQRWLLQEKRTQAWDTPINSVNAVYAFLKGGSLKLGETNAVVKVDAQPLEMPKATAAIGYVKTSVPAGSKRLTIDKSTEGTSWGAVYAQFTQPTKHIADAGSGLTIKRELLTPKGEKPTSLKVGDRIVIRLTITADRDYDFVQVLDKRAACMEPVRQMSGWHSGSYCTPRDYSTNYYFDCLSKGTHVIENEYFIDRQGTYETGTCTVGCAYAPEFRATTHSETLKIIK